MVKPVPGIPITDPPPMPPCRTDREPVQSQLDRIEAKLAALIEMTAALIDAHNGDYDDYGETLLDLDGDPAGAERSLDGEL